VPLDEERSFVRHSATLKRLAQCGLRILPNGLRPADCADGSRLTTAGGPAQNKLIVTPEQALK
jgi:hypothetical protein